MATGGYGQSIYSAEDDEGLRQSIYSAEDDGEFGQSIYSTEADDAVGGRVSNLCHPCERHNKTTPATLRCTTCNERLCDGCSKNHKIYIQGNHVFVDFYDTTNRRTLVDMKGLDKCPEHGNTVVYQCKDHNNVLCCTDCHYESHHKCDNLIKLSQLAERSDTGKVCDFDKDISECISVANDVANNSDQQAIELNNDKTCDEVDRAKKKIIQLLDEAKARIKLEYAESNKRETQRLQIRKSTALNVKSELEKSQSVNKLVQRHGTNIQKYIMQAVSRNKLEQAKAELNDMSKNDYTVKGMLEWDTYVLTVLNMHDIEVALKVCNN